MKIVHFCLSCFYIDGYAYQENQLPAQHVKDGHEVTIIASTETFDAQRLPAYLEPGDYMGSDGARVIRLPYRRALPARLAQKVRAYPGVRSLLDQLKPDMILFHGMCAWELLTVASYVRDHPEVTLYVDCHEDFNNSARSGFSKHVLHGSFYRPILRSALDVIRQVLCITVESIAFARDFYGVPAEQVALFPLAGNVHGHEAYHERRRAARTALGVGEDQTVVVQSGKITANKRLVQALSDFIATVSPRLRFWIVGEIVDMKEECQRLIDSDPRITYLGWKTPEELENILCAADIYLQPVGQTATTQMSMCCRCAILVQDVPSHRALFNDNGFLLGESTTIRASLEKAARDPMLIEAMKQRSYEFACEHLDYVRLARKITNQ